jgi:hypothetical protein
MGASYSLSTKKALPEPSRVFKYEKNLTRFGHGYRLIGLFVTGVT